LISRAPVRRYDSVQQDWRGILPLAKGMSFTGHTGQLEKAYLMFSVVLNEVITLRQRNDLTRARLGVAVVGELCSPLSLRINAVLHTMRQFARHFGIVPNFALLAAENFQSECGQRAARHSNLLSRVLLSERSQFLNKLNTLEEIVHELGDEVLAVSRQLAADTYSGKTPLWQRLDLSHFDLNTCLRETNVLLKSFLFVLPEDQLATFDFTVAGLARARRPQSYCTPDVELIRARRTAAVAGE